MKLLISRQHQLQTSESIALGVVFLGTCLVTVLFLLLLPASYQINESTDYLTYYAPVANHILAGDGLITLSDQPAVRYPPGYPIILAILFSLTQAIGLPQEQLLPLLTVLCMGLAALGIFMLARPLWGTWPGLLASVAWATYPLALWGAKQPNSELPFTVCLYAALWFWVAPRPNEANTRDGLAGLLTGTAMLIRPIAIGLPIVLLLWLGWREGLRPLFWSRAGWFMVGVLFLVLPWEIWMYQDTGQWLPLSSGGTVSIVDGLTFAVDDLEVRESIAIPDAVQAVMLDLQAVSEKGQLSSVGAVLRTLSLAFEKNPTGVIGLIGIKALRSWYATDSGRFEIPSLLVQIIYLSLIIWGGWVAWRDLPPHRPYLVLIALLTLYFWAMTLLVLSIVRYMLPLIGLLLTLLPGIWLSLKRWSLFSRRMGQP